MKRNAYWAGNINEEHSKCIGTKSLELSRETFEGVIGVARECVFGFERLGSTRLELGVSRAGRARQAGFCFLRRLRVRVGRGGAPKGNKSDSGASV